MRHFKHEPKNLNEILNQLLWYNKNLKIKKEQIFLKNWERAGIKIIRDIFSDYGSLLTLQELKTKFNLTTNFLQLLQIQACIPKMWIQEIKNAKLPLLKSKNEIFIELHDSVKPLYLVTCKDFYWFLIKNNEHTPRSLQKWHETYNELNNKLDNKWTDIYETNFHLLKDTKIQSFQYRINHRILACNNWLKQIKIKTSNICNFCNHIDTIQHFLIHCDKTKQFWNSFITWWNNSPNNNLFLLSNISESDEINLLFGFPGGTDNTTVLNYCTGYAKYFIYIQKINTNTIIDFYSYLPMLKSKLDIEKNIHLNNNTEHKFNKFNKL
jgi:hypothetical protein